MADASPHLPYLPVTGAPWRLTMGLRPLRAGTWLEVDGRRASELAQKASLLATAREDVVGIVPGSEFVQAELAALIAEDLATFHGEVSGTELAGDEPPIVAAARLVQEDLCCFERRGGRWFMTAACVCFPSRWTLATKVGADLTAIHDPVPGYDAQLAAPVERFFDRLEPSKPMWRLNWTVLDTDELHLPTPSARRALALPSDLGDLTFRVERQTFRALPVSGGVVFTIRTTTARLGDLVASDAAVAADLHATLSTVDDDVAAYKGWTDLLGPLLTWLEVRR